MHLKLRVKHAVGLIFLLTYNSLFAQVPTFIAKQDAGITDVIDFSIFYGHGISAADFDQDGDIDLYLSTTSGERDRLYLNDGTGVFQNVANQRGINITTGSRMAIWFDYDSDNILDIVILGERCATFNCGRPILISLLRQNENGNFEDVTTAAGLTFGERYEGLSGAYAAGGMSVGDINNDGYLDLLVAVWGARITLFENNGDGTFSDVSEQSKIGVTDAYFWQPMFYDFNGDGAIDVFLNVDFGKNQLWINDGKGSFYETASQVGLATDFSEMGMTINDYDNDGDFDIYATNITRDFQGVHEHNVLLRNDSEAGFMVFNEVGPLEKVGDSGWDWGATFFDANNDGWVDLASTNGWNGDPNWGADKSKFWLNSVGSFSDQSSASQFDDALDATTLIAADIDRDGDLDLIQTLKDNPDTKLPAIVYENKLENNFNYLVVRPRMTGKNHWAIGAVVKLKSAALFNMRLISAGSSFFGQEPMEAYFGLGSKTQADEVEILWPDGSISIYENIAANQVITLENEVINPPSELTFNLTAEFAEISWSDNSINETGFKLQKSATKNFINTEEIVVGENISSYQDQYDLALPFYRVKAFNDNVSSTYSEIFNIKQVIASLSDEMNQPVNLFPNPSLGSFTISFTNNYFGEIKMELVDLSGRKVWDSSLIKENELFKTDVRIQLKRGLYLMKIKFDKHLITARVHITG